jgi:DNA-directed RNA polymerase subunit M/transcription elongation factor TFIIS
MNHEKVDMMTSTAERQFYRCPDCKHTFEEPRNAEGEVPSLVDNVECPKCHHNWIVMFYIKLKGTSDRNACA